MVLAPAIHRLGWLPLLIHADNVVEINLFLEATVAKIAALSNEQALRVFAETIVIAVLEKALAGTEYKKKEKHGK
jgi:hypothetical protein